MLWKPKLPCGQVSISTKSLSIQYWETCSARCYLSVHCFQWITEEIRVVNNICHCWIIQQKFTSPLKMHIIPAITSFAIHPISTFFLALTCGYDLMIIQTTVPPKHRRYSLFVFMTHNWQQHNAKILFRREMKYKGKQLVLPPFAHASGNSKSFGLVSGGIVESKSWNQMKSNWFQLLSALYICHVIDK